MNTLFLGCGKMGSIILNNMISEKSIKSSKITILKRTHNCDIDGVKIYNKIEDLVDKNYKADLVFIAIKPQDSEETLRNLKDSKILSEKTIFVSILAGKKISYFEDIFGSGAKIVRSMPNLGIQEAQGILLYQENINIDNNESTILNNIFQKFGLAYKISDEKLFDPLTAIFGSGPAYLFLLQDILSGITQKFDVSKKDSDDLVKQLFLGTSLLSCNSEHDFNQLKENVTSKGGVTKAGLDVLEDHDSLKTLFSNVIDNANKRSKELS